MNLPNWLSISRIAIAPVFFLMIISEDKTMIINGCILYFIGASTDYIDGWLARKYGAESSLGKFLDPLADKILTTAAFFTMYTLEMIPLWMIIVVIIRDLAITALRIGAESRGLHVKTLYSAQVKTFIQMTFQMIVFSLLLLESVFKSGFFNNIIFFRIAGTNATTFVMFLITIITIWTLVEYIILNNKTISLIFFDAGKKNN